MDKETIKKGIKGKVRHVGDAVRQCSGLQYWARLTDFMSDGILHLSHSGQLAKLPADTDDPADGMGMSFNQVRHALQPSDATQLGIMGDWHMPSWSP